MAVYKLRWCVRGYHVFQEDWDADFGDELECLKALGQYISGIRLLNLNTAVTEQVNGNSTT